MPSIRQVLDSHERELLQRRDQLRDQLQGAEAELEEVRRAKAALTGSDQSGSPHAVVVDDDRYARMTNKQLAVAALEQHFTSGAKASELVSFFKSRWNREIDRSTFSPQLTRLLRDGLVEKDGMVWRLKKDTAPKHASGPHDVPRQGNQTEAD